MSENRNSGGVGGTGDVRRDDGRIASEDWLKDWVDGGPEWVRLLKVSNGIGFCGRSKNSAIKWYLAAQSSFKGGGDSFADVTFVRHTYKGALRMVKVNFHSAGLARIYHVEEFDCSWSIGLCVAMPRYICVPLDWMYEEYRLASRGASGCICKFRDFLACQRFPQLKEEFACEASEGSVSEPGHNPLLVPASVVVVNSVEAAPAIPVASARPTIVCGTASVVPSAAAATALMRMRTSRDDTTSFSSDSDSSIMDVWDDIDA